MLSQSSTVIDLPQRRKRNEFIHVYFKTEYKMLHLDKTTVAGKLDWEFEKLSQKF